MSAAAAPEDESGAACLSMPSDESVLIDAKGLDRRRLSSTRGHASSRCSNPGDGTVVARLTTRFPEAFLGGRATVAAEDLVLRRETGRPSDTGRQTGVWLHT